MAAQADHTAGGNIACDAEIAHPCPDAAPEYLNDLEADGDTLQARIEQYLEVLFGLTLAKLLARLVALPPLSTDLAVGHSAVFTAEKLEVDYRWNRRKGWLDWNELYAGVDLRDVDSINTVIERFDSVLEHLGELQNDRGAFWGLPDPSIGISDVRAKMNYELRHLERQRTFLKKRDQARGQSSIYPDLIDSQLLFDPTSHTPRDPRVSISLTHAWGMTMSERKDIADRFKIYTLHGAEQAVEWLKAQIRILCLSPLHYQPNRPLLQKKSCYLEDVEELLANWSAGLKTLRKWHAVGRPISKMVFHGVFFHGVDGKKL